jgi:hypothetical protein
MIVSPALTVQIGKESVYVLVLQLPLRGILRSGGLVFVLKATANQADK